MEVREDKQVNYHYPIDETWTTTEITDVINFFTMVEKAYENQVKADEIVIAYKRFKQIVPAKSEEKQLFATFKKASGYNSYPVVKKARDEGGTISMSRGKA